MNLNIRMDGPITLVTIEGELDGTTAPMAQAQLMPAVVPGCKLLIDMSQVGYMSSAGLRMLLAAYRSVSAKGGRVVLVGLAEELEDTMSVTGFLDFFDHVPTVDAGRAALA